MACVSGELGCCELELENTDPGPIGRLCLVRQTPGLVSVGKKNEEKSLCDFPLIENSGHRFRRQNEDVTVEQVLTVCYTDFCHNRSLTKPLTSHNLVTLFLPRTFCPAALYNLKSKTAK